jgi:hypothetical protein
VTQHPKATDIAFDCQAASPAAIAGADSRVEILNALQVPAGLLVEVARDVARSDAEPRENSKEGSRVDRNLAHIRNSHSPPQAHLAVVVVSCCRAEWSPALDLLPGRWWFAPMPILRTE